MHRVSVGTLPLVASVERTPLAPAQSPGRGRVVGVSERGARIVFDVAQGYVARVDAGGESARLTIVGAQDPMNPGLVGVDDSGDVALVMACRSAFGDPQLVKVDLQARNTEVVRAFDGPGWVCGGFASRKRIIVCEQRLGDKPRFAVVVQGRIAWSAEGMQQPCVPAGVADDVVALVLCLKPDPVTGTGPSSLCVLDVAGGAIRPLAPAEGTRVVVERDGADGKARTLVVEGGKERVRAVLK